MAHKAITRNNHIRSVIPDDSPGLFAKLMRAVKTITSKMIVAVQIANERRTLSDLNDHQLRDIGMSRDQLRSELTRGVFDIPSQRYYDLGFRSDSIRETHHTRLSRLPMD